jgi:hypothetical protein
MVTPTKTEESEKHLRDVAGRRHRVSSAPCEECGCSYWYSLDEPGLVWEAGTEVEDDCLDILCDCHLDPIMGLRFRIHLAS